MESSRDLMLISLHQNATTTPAIRAAIQKATGSDYEPARQFNVTRETIRRWRKRDTVQDGSHTAHRLQTPLNAGREELVIYLNVRPSAKTQELFDGGGPYLEISPSGGK